jgi:hypothetical protein
VGAEDPWGGVRLVLRFDRVRVLLHPARPLVHVSERQVRTDALRTVNLLLSSVRRNLSTHLCRPGAWRQYFLAATGRRGTFGKLVLSSLQSGARSGPQIRCGIYVRADRGYKAAAKIGGAADLFLPAVLGLSGYGTSSGGRSQHCCVEHDP